MVWARIPPDKLINLPLFGIDIIAEDGDLLWFRGPSGRMCVDKRMPRVWFEDISDASQAGATAIKISNAEELSAMKQLADTPVPEVPEREAASNTSAIDEAGSLAS